VRVAIVGGTGPFGRALAIRLREAGHQVTLGSRDAGRATSAADELGVSGATNERAVGDAELVLLAVDADAAVLTAKTLRGAIRAPVLSVASQLEFVGASARPAAEVRSVAEQVAAVLEVPVTAGLHSLPARVLAKRKPDADALVCGPDGDGKDLALELAAGIVSGRGVDCGPLEVARALEGMTAALVNVNRRYKAHAALRLTGLA
jgi:8-hydroxy-5-deazaflavin:NADPH oxidoreductase